jgi:hypothetical protein
MVARSRIPVPGPVFVPLGNFRSGLVDAFDGFNFFSLGFRGMLFDQNKKAFLLFFLKSTNFFSIFQTKVLIQGKDRKSQIVINQIKKKGRRRKEEGRRDHEIR